MTKRPPPSKKDSKSAIKSVADFVAWVDKHGGRRMLYRGLTDDDYKASSSLYRRLLNSRVAKSVSDSMFIKAANQLIETAKKEGHNYKNGRELPALELLAELQHHGAATCLIDFTKNPLVALWFACLSPHKNKNGKVIALDTSSADKFGAAKGDERDIAPFFSSGKLHQWTPPKQNNRIVAQQSVFVFGKPVIPDDETNYSCIIHGESKNDILSELRNRYGVSAESLFCDFSGFAREVNGHDKEYREWTTEETAEDYFHFGVFHQQRGEMQEAVAEYDKAIVLNPKDAAAYNNRGNAKDDLGDHAAAIEDFSQAIALNSKDAVAYYNRGNAKFRSGEHAAAVEDFSQAIALNSKDAATYYNRGVAKGHLGDYAGAIENFDEAIKINPEYVETYNNRGVAKGHLGDLAAAIEDFSQAIMLNPKYADAYNNRGIAKGHLGDHAAAVEDFSQAIELNPEYAKAYNNRGIAKGRLGDHAAAIEDFNQTIALNPKDAEAYNNRGNAKGRLGDHAAAVEDFSQAIALNPKYAKAYYNRGVAKFNTGDKAGALADFREANRLDNSLKIPRMLLKDGGGGGKLSGGGKE